MTRRKIKDNYSDKNELSQGALLHLINDLDLNLTNFSKELKIIKRNLSYLLCLIISAVIGLFAVLLMIISNFNYE